MDIALLRYAHLMETIAKNNPAFGRSIESGLERVSTDHEFLVHAFSQVLESLGVTGASKLLKERISPSLALSLIRRLFRQFPFIFNCLILWRSTDRGAVPASEKKNWGEMRNPGDGEETLSN